jgi:hypothetical protein
VRESCAHPWQAHQKLSRQILKLAFDELTRIRPYRGKAFRSPYTALNDAVQSRSAPYSLDPSLSRLLGHVGRRPGCLPAWDPIDTGRPAAEEQLRDVQHALLPDDVKWDRWRGASRQWMEKEWS